MNFNVQALDWLKSNYWEAQRRAIPDVRKEIRSRLRELIFVLKNKYSQSLASRKRSKKHISSITKRIGRLYSSYPLEVVSVLLEFLHLQTTDLSENIDMEHSDDSVVDEPVSLVGSLSDLKIIITELSNKKPGLILSILKTVIEILEASETRQFANDCDHISTSKKQCELEETGRLCSLFHWLLMNFKALKESSRIGVVGEGPVLSTDRNAAPKVSVLNLFRKCVSLSITGDKYLFNSTLLLAEMVGNGSLTKKLKKIALLRARGQEFVEDYNLTCVSKMLQQEEVSIKQATEKLEFLRSRLRNQSSNTRNSTEGNIDTIDGTWTVTKSWIPCPIGMLPCSFSSAAVLPVLDKVDESSKPSKAELKIDKDDTDTNTEHVMGNHHITDGSESDGNHDENRSGSKRLRISRQVQESDLLKMDLMEGHLLIGGIWKKVSEDECMKDSSVSLFV